ncbi:hypothetical protein [Sinomonas sp. ASV322]|uniref:hypothetical protein n=1 Tax=Sinomonas sp. ASV322 TaxID=3041920 RepID=UPI0027DC8BC2|nr:hypothetical protein [Sinomonas sp. ASV322]MDQ4502930.1 hypothetical protein [Sinomonas sp. ASV322]
MAQENFTQRFMRATGKLRAVFGPAHRGTTEGEMTDANKALLAQREAEAQQWETVTRPDGSTYVVPKDPGDQSLR